MRYGQIQVKICQKMSGLKKNCGHWYNPYWKKIIAPRIFSDLLAFFKISCINYQNRTKNIANLAKFGPKSSHISRNGPRGQFEIYFNGQSMQYRSRKKSKFPARYLGIWFEILHVEMVIVLWKDVCLLAPTWARWRIRAGHRVCVHPFAWRPVQVAADPGSTHGLITDGIRAAAPCRPVTPATEQVWKKEKIRRRRQLTDRRKSLFDQDPFW